MTAVADRMVSSILIGFRNVFPRHFLLIILFCKLYQHCNYLSLLLLPINLGMANLEKVSKEICNVYGNYTESVLKYVTREDCKYKFNKPDNKSTTIAPPKAGTTDRYIVKLVIAVVTLGFVSLLFYAAVRIYQTSNKRKLATETDLSFSGDKKHKIIRIEGENMNIDIQGGFVQGERSFCCLVCFDK